MTKDTEKNIQFSIEFNVTHWGYEIPNGIFFVLLVSMFPICKWHTASAFWVSHVTCCNTDLSINSTSKPQTLSKFGLDCFVPFLLKLSQSLAKPMKTPRKDYKTSWGSRLTLVTVRGKQLLLQWVEKTWTRAWRHWSRREPGSCEMSKYKGNEEDYRYETALSIFFFF